MKTQPALKAFLVLSVGIIIARFLRIPFPIVFYSFLFLITVTLFLFFTKQFKSLTQLLIALCLILLGFIRYQETLYILPKNHIKQYLNIDKSIVLQGILVKDPVKKAGRTELVVEARSLISRDSLLSVTGKIIISVYKKPSVSFRYGDEISAIGFLQKPKGRRNPGGFNYREYLGRKNIYGILKILPATEIKTTRRNQGNFFLREIVYPARRFMIKIIDQTTFGSNRSILHALIVGEKGTISPEVRDSFAKAGVIHVLAVSGLHVGFVLIIFMTIFGLLRIPYETRVFLTILALAFYAFLTEAKAPVVRAAAMASIYLIGTLLERKTDSFNVIGVTALALCLIKPSNLFDVGFQLSFVAVFSIIYFYQKLNYLPFITKLRRTFAKNRIPNYCLTILLVSLSAQFGTIPLTAIYFNRIPILSIFANIFVIPLTGIIVALGFTSLLFGIISPWIAGIYGALNQELLSFLIKIVSWMGNLPFSYISVPTPDIFWVIIYFLFLLLLFNFQNTTLRKRFAFLLLISLNLTAWKGALWNNSAKITWIQFDVGQGDAALIHLPRGRILIIDGGEKKRFFDNGERVIAPYLRKKGIRRIDAVILSHPHNDHVGGLIYILNHFKVKEVITANTPFESQLYKEFLETIKKKKIPTHIVTAPDSITEFPGVKLYFLSPKKKRKTEIKDQSHDINNNSLVIRILFGRTRILFTGDAEKEAENDILLSGYSLFSNGIKVGHHGSTTSSTLSFLKRVMPEQAVISVGEHNKYHFPSPIIIQRLQMLGVAIHRTDKEGAVIFRSDGKELKKVKWRKLFKQKNS